MIFQTQVSGIPCQCKVLAYFPGEPAIIGKNPESCFPPEYSEIDFELLDRNGRRATWLEAKLKDNDFDRILEEYECLKRQEKFSQH